MYALTHLSIFFSSFPSRGGCPWRGCPPPPFPGVLRGSRSGDPAGELPPQRGLPPSLRSPWGARPSFSAARRGRESATGSGEDNAPGPPAPGPPAPGAATMLPDWQPLSWLCRGVEAACILLRQGRLPEEAWAGSKIIMRFYSCVWRGVGVIDGEILWNLVLVYVELWRWENPLVPERREGLGCSEAGAGFLFCFYIEHPCWAPLCWWISGWCSCVW